MSARMRGLSLLGVVALVASSVLTCGSPATGPAGDKVPAAGTEELATIATVAPEHTPTEPAPTESQGPVAERASDTPGPTDTPQVTVETPTATPTATLAPGEPPPPSSTDLIRQALEAGELDAETALVYEVYAAAADSRLPAAYRGYDAQQIDSLALGRAVEMWDALSPETRRLLVPYRLPPSAPGSWLELREAEANAPAGRGSSAGGPSSQALASAAGAVGVAQAAPRVQWNKVWAVDGIIKVWYQERHKAQDEAIAKYLASQIRDRIYPELQGLMGRALLPDEGYACLDEDGDPIWEEGREVCHGDDGALDVYLVHGWGCPGQIIAYESCQNAPSFILIDTDWLQVRSSMAHELMHAFQYLYNACSEYDWIAEATATWAEDFVYRRVEQAEQPKAPWYLKDTSQPLEKTNGAREYGAYVFFFYLTHRPQDLTHGPEDPDLIRRVWENTEQADSLDAVNNAIPGGFASVWHEFAVYNWNQPPYDDYVTWDNLKAHADPDGGTIDATEFEGLYPLELPDDELEHLSIVYKHLKFGGDQCRMVTFFNGLTHELEEKEIDLTVDGLAIQDGSKVYDWETVQAEDRERVRVQALYKIEGDSEWHEVEDWTELPYISFCRDAKAERLSELLIIFSNSQHKPRNYTVAPKGLAPAVWVRNIGCWRWEGEAKVEMDVDHAGSKAGEQIFTIPKVVWERDEAFPDIPYPYVTYHLLEGELEFEFSYADSRGCTGQGSDSRTLEPQQQASPLLDVLWAEEQAAALQTFYGVTQGPSQRRYLGWGFDNRDLPVEVICPDEHGGGTHRVANWTAAIWTGFWFPLTFWTFHTGQVFSLGDDGNRMQDGFDWDGTREDWDFEALRE